jgi:hypothetical protein
VSGVTNPLSVSLDNLAGRPPTLRLIGAVRRSATVDTRYRRPLEVEVAGANGKPVEGATVTFTLGAAAAGGGAAASSSAGASFIGGSAQATETTGASGIATSPTVVADATAGTFTATASTSGTTRVVSVPLRNLAGKPTTVTAGAASSESATVGARFPIRLAVTVTDSDRNPIAGVPVTFTASARGPSGTFTRPHGSAYTITVRTNASGIAVASAFTANGSSGGYIVKATVKGAEAVAFALVNEPPSP